MEPRAGIGDIFPEFLNVDVLRHDGKLYAVPFTWGTLSMIYDPAAIAAPTSWKDCLKALVPAVDARLH
jgi:spermidine/putrescine-binding protein